MAMVDEEAQARVDVWKYAYGSITSEVIKTAIDLDIPELLENRGGAPISLSDLSAAVGCQPQTIYRIMRFLIYHGLFRRIKGSHNDDDDVYYTQSPLSRLFMKKYLGVAPLIGISRGILKARPDLPALDYNKIWSDTDDNNIVGASTFSEGMAAHARVTTSAIIEHYAEDFRGVGSVVDVGGLHGATISMLVEAFPWVRGICFDLPDVVVRAPPIEGVEFIGGSMFESVPRADAVILMWILHNWSDEECINILKKCKESVPEGTGKVMIVEAVVDEDDEEAGDAHKGARLALDMMMLGGTGPMKDKERTYKEWAQLLNEAGFSRHNVVNINTVESVIEAYPAY